MRIIRLAAALLAASLASGCGRSGTVAAAGKIVKGGEPYAVPKGQTLRVAFHAAEVKDEAGKEVGDGRVYPAVVNLQDGRFTVPGEEGYGIPPGKYRVAITQNPKAGEGPAAARGKARVDDDTDLLDGRYSSPLAPILVDVDGKADLTIDLAKSGVPPAINAPAHPHDAIGARRAGRPRPLD